MPGTYLKLSPKNQITLPKRITRNFPGAEYFEVTIRENEVVLRPARVSVQGDALARVRDKIKNLGLAEEIIPDAVSFARHHNQ